MQFVPKLHLSGRASIAALAGLSALIVGGSILLARKAHAQTIFVKPVIFAPSFTQSIDTRLPGIHHLTVQAWLPAVQRGDTPFTMRVDMGDGSVAVLSNPPSLGGRSMAIYEIFLTGDDRVGLVVHILNRLTGEEATSPTTSHLIAPCWLPGANADGGLSPISIGESFVGRQNAVMADGSVLPIPFQYGIQAPTS